MNKGNRVWDRAMSLTRDRIWNRIQDRENMEPAERNDFWQNRLHGSLGLHKNRSFLVLTDVWRRAILQSSREEIKR